MLSGYREGEKPNTGKRRGALYGVTVPAWRGGQPKLRHCYSGGRRPQAEDVGDYDLMKNNLLKRFRLTEGGYRKRFKSGETAEQFVDRLKKYLMKWREMAGFDATYEGLQI